MGMKRTSGRCVNPTNVDKVVKWRLRLLTLWRESPIWTHSQLRVNAKNIHGHYLAADVDVVGVCVCILLLLLHCPPPVCLHLQDEDSPRGLRVNCSQAPPGTGPCCWTGDPGEERLAVSASVWCWCIEKVDFVVAFIAPFKISRFHSSHEDDVRWWQNQRDRVEKITFWPDTFKIQQTESNFQPTENS